MKLEEIERLVQRIACSAIERLELEVGRERLVLHRPVVYDVAGQGLTHTETAGAAPDFIRAPAAGVFYASHPLADDTFALADRVVEPGEAVGYLRVGSVLSAVNALERGVPGEQLVESGTLVGFGKALFALEKVA